MDLTLFAFGPCVIAPSHGFTFDRDLALDEKLKKQTFKATEEMIIAGRYVLAFTEDFHSRYMTESFFIHCGAFPSIVELFLWLHLESEQTQYDKKTCTSKSFYRFMTVSSHLLVVTLRKGSICFTRGSLAPTQELRPPYSVTSAKRLTSNDT